MLEIAIIVCALAVLIWTPIESRKVRAGWVRPKFKGTPEEFRARYVRQLSIMRWVGLVLALGNLAIALFMADSDNETISKLVIAALWFGVAAVNFLEHRKFPADPISRR